MNKTEHEKILIIVALVLCAGVIFYNAFFVPEVSVPTVVYVDKSADEGNSESADGSNDYIASDENASLNGKVNINTASATELAENLDGIGTAIAQRIVEYRESNGKFASIEDIKNVSGVGESKYEQIKDSICV